MNAHRCLGLCAAAVLLAGGLVVAQDAAKDLKALQGAWEVTKATDNGKDVPPGMIAEMRFIFERDALTMAAPKKGEDKKFTLKLDPAKKPKEIDLTHKGTTTPGLYELDGDTLTLCLPPPTGTVRPKKMESKEGSRLTVIVLKRVKKKS